MRKLIYTIILVVALIMFFVFMNGVDRLNWFGGKVKRVESDAVRYEKGFVKDLGKSTKKKRAEVKKSLKKKTDKLKKMIQ